VKNVGDAAQAKLRRCMLWSEFASTLVQVGKCTHFYEALLLLVAAEVESEEMKGEAVRRCVLVEHAVEPAQSSTSMDVQLSRTCDVVSNVRVSGVFGGCRACLVVDGEEQWFEDLGAVTLLMALAMNQRVSVRVYVDPAVAADGTPSAFKLLYDGCVLSSEVRHEVQAQAVWRTATHEYGGGVMTRIDCSV
jgi:hypothetical protein